MRAVRSRKAALCSRHSLPTRDCPRPPPPEVLLVVQATTMMSASLLLLAAAGARKRGPVSTARELRRLLEALGLSKARRGAMVTCVPAVALPCVSRVSVWSRVFSVI